MIAIICGIGSCIRLGMSLSEIRGVRVHLERRSGFALASADALLAWIPTCSADELRVNGEVRMERLLGNEIRVENGLVKALRASVCT